MEQLLSAEEDSRNHKVGFVHVWCLYPGLFALYDDYCSSQ
jgi:hypothetical protein